MKPSTEMARIESIENKLAASDKKLTVLVANRKIPFFENVIIKEEKSPITRFVLSILQALGLFSKGYAALASYKDRVFTQLKLQEGEINGALGSKAQVNQAWSAARNQAAKADAAAKKAEHLGFQNKHNQRDLQNEGERLRTANALGEANRQRVNRIGKQMKSLSRELQRTKARLAVKTLQFKRAEEAAAKAEAKVESLKSKVADLSRAESDLHHEVDAANNRANAFQQKNGSAMRTIRGQRRALEKAERENAQAQKDLRRLSEEKEELATDKAELEGKLKTATTELERVKADAATKGKLLAMTEAKLEDTNELIATKEKRALWNYNKRVEAQGENRKLRKELEAAKQASAKKVVGLEKQLQSVNERLERATAALSRKDLEVESNVNLLRRKQRKLIREIEVARGENEAAQAKIEKLTNANSELSEAYDRSQRFGRFQNFVMNRKIASISSLKAKLKSVNEKLEQMNGTLNERNLEVAKLYQKQERLENDLNAAVERELRAGEALNIKSKQADALDTAVVKEIAAKKEIQRKASAEVASLKKQLDSLKGKLGRATDALNPRDSGVERRVNELRQEQVRLRNALNVAQHELAAANGDKRELKDKLGVAERRHNRVAHDLMITTSRASALEKAVASEAAAKEAAEKEAAANSKLFNMTNARLQTANAVANAKQRRNEELTSELADVKSDRNAYRTRLEVANERRQVLRDELVSKTRAHKKQLKEEREITGEVIDDLSTTKVQADNKIRELKKAIRKQKEALEAYAPAVQLDAIRSNFAEDKVRRPKQKEFRSKK